MLQELCRGATIQARTLTNSGPALQRASATDTRAACCTESLPPPLSCRPPAETSIAMLRLPCPPQSRTRWLPALQEKTSCKLLNTGPKKRRAVPPFRGGISKRRQTSLPPHENSGPLSMPIRQWKPPPQDLPPGPAAAARQLPNLLVTGARRSRRGNPRSPARGQSAGLCRGVDLTLTSAPVFPMPCTCGCGDFPKARRET